MKYTRSIYEHRGPIMLFIGERNIGKTKSAYGMARQFVSALPEPVPLVTNLDCFWPAKVMRFHSLPTACELLREGHLDVPHGMVMLLDELQEYCNTLDPRGRDVLELYKVQTQLRKLHGNLLMTGPEWERVSGVIRRMVDVFILPEKRGPDMVLRFYSKPEDVDRDAPCEYGWVIEDVDRYQDGYDTFQMQRRM